MNYAVRSQIMSLLKLFSFIFKVRKNIVFFQQGDITTSKLYNITYILNPAQCLPFCLVSTSVNALTIFYSDKCILTKVNEYFMKNWQVRIFIIRILIKFLLG